MRDVFLGILLFGGVAIAGESELRITRIDPATDRVWVTHLDVTTYVTTDELPFCHRFNYASSIPSGTTFGFFETQVFTVPGLHDSNSDLWLYRSSNFSDAANIITGLQYGPTDTGRTGIARAANLWTGTNPEVPADGGGLEISGSTVLTLPVNGSNWIATALPYEESGITIGAVTIAEGPFTALGVRQPPDETDRLFIIDQDGKVLIHVNGALLPSPFLDASALLSPRSNLRPEIGFLGLTFHPDFGSNGFVYTYTSELASGGTADFTLLPAGTPDHHSVVRRWTVRATDRNQIDPASSTELLRIEQPRENNNAGDITFGPDNFLYIPLGDGGGGAKANAQNLDTLLGCIARIDVDGSNAANGKYGIPSDNPLVGQAGLDEIYATGFRNPYRISFDPITGALYAADVGTSKAEEVNLIVAGGNYGWPIKEGTIPSDTSLSDPGNLIDPIAQYRVDDIPRAVIGGYVWPKGPGMLKNEYIFGDYLGRVFRISSGRVQSIDIGNSGLGIIIRGFGTDNAGHLYVCGQSTVKRLGPLLEITDIQIDDTTIRLDFSADEFLRNFTIEGTTDLSATNWTPRPFIISPAGDGYQAELPNVTRPADVFRVRSE